MTDAELLELAQDWKHAYHSRDIHCSNCRHCIVDKEDSSRALCEVGHCTKLGGIYLKLSSLTKSTNPSEFQSAYDCYQFDSMSDEHDNR